jgi:hypothetical protein
VRSRSRKGQKIKKDREGGRCITGNPSEAQKKGGKRTGEKKGVKKRKKTGKEAGGLEAVQAKHILVSSAEWYFACVYEPHARSLPAAYVSIREHT